MLKLEPAQDSALPWLEDSLDPAAATRKFRDAAIIADHARVEHARLIRHKAGRRFVVEYVIRDSGARTSTALIGKSRAKGLDRRVVDIMAALQANGFSGGAADGISIPAVAGVVGEWSMWVADKVEGTTVTDLISAGAAEPGLIARAARKLHSARLEGLRFHSAEDEVNLLDGYLADAAGLRPDIAVRARRLAEACGKVAGELSEGIRTTIHRDFYGDQLIADGQQLYVLDLDQICEGDPRLDIGNFMAHVAEQSLRAHGRITPFFDSVRETLLDQAATSEVDRHDIRVYELLSLARHVWISIRIEARSHLTEVVLAECEQQLRRNPY